MPIAHIHAPGSFDGLTSQSTDAEIRANPQVRELYGALLDRYPNHPIVCLNIEHGRSIRWQENSVVRLMTDSESANRVSLNQLWYDFAEKKLPVEDMAAVYRMMGYSLCGFVEIFGELIDGI